MKDLKIHVANEAESKEAQELFFDLGYYWAYKNLGKKLLLSKNNVYLFAESDRTLGTGTHQDEVFFNNWRGKEITLQELRDMVNPMKEYLEKQADGSYKLVMRGIVGKDDDIEVPEGADSYNEYTKGESNNTFFLKMIGDTYYFANEESGREWEWYAGELRGHEFKLWQRHTQPEELPFIDDEPKYTDDEVKYMDENGQGRSQSINDQYAEIEQVRQQTIEATLVERQAQYGCFEDVAFVTENIMAVLSKVRTNGLNDLPHTHRMALYMIASKMARIVNGDFNSIDGWHDISGYATLVERLIDG